MNVVFLASSDSTLRCSILLAQKLCFNFIDCEVYSIDKKSPETSGNSASNFPGASNPPLKPIIVRDLETFLNLIKARRFNWIFLGLSSVLSRYFFHRFKNVAFAHPPPFVASFCAGILFRRKNDTFAARSASDLMLVNSPLDFADFISLTQSFNSHKSRAFNFGLCTSLSCTDQTDSIKSRKRQRVVFYCQDEIPQTSREKLYILSELQRLSIRFPEFEFCIKPRTRPPSRFNLNYRSSFPSLVDRLNSRRLTGSQPLLIVNEDPRDLILNSTLSLSVSSSVIIESLACGTPAVAISDLGAFDEYGSHFFNGSGILRKISEIDLYQLPEVQKDWLLQNMTLPDSKLPQLVKLLFEITSSGKPSNSHFLEESPLDGSKEFNHFIQEDFGQSISLTKTYRERKNSLKFQLRQRILSLLRFM